MKKNSEISSKYIFQSGKEQFLSMSIASVVVLFLGGTIEIYKIYFQYLYILMIITILILAYIMTYPSFFKYLYYRWLVFTYNKTTTFSVDIEQKLFVYKHDEEEISFTSADVEKWSVGAHETWNTTFIRIIRIKLKNGKKVEISSGIGDVEEFLQEHREQLGLPKSVYRYGDDFTSLQSYMRRNKLIRI